VKLKINNNPNNTIRGIEGKEKKFENMYGVD